jgi:hypothetical protein
MNIEEVRQLVVGLGFTAHLRSRGEEKRDIRQLGYRARRWVVERTHGWMNRNRIRGLLIRWAEKAENYSGLCAPGLRHHYLVRNWSTRIGSKCGCNTSSRLSIKLFRYSRGYAVTGQEGRIYFASCPSLLTVRG